MSAALLPLIMSAEEFLAWDPPDNSERWELVDGAPVAMAPPSYRHAMLHSETARLLGNHLADQRPDCRIGIGAGLRPSDYDVRIPDLTVACGPMAIAGNLREPVLVIEILSPSNVADTRSAVVRYMAMPTVQEILVLDSREAAIGAELWRRTADGWAHITAGKDDVLELASISFSAPLGAFYRTA